MPRNTSGHIKWNDEKKLIGFVIGAGNDNKSLESIIALVIFNYVNISRI